MRKLWIAASLGALASAPFGWAQASPTKPEFEVASVKPNTACGGRRGLQISGPPSPGRLNLECVTVENLVQAAYVILGNGKPNLKLVEIVGGPAWIHSDTYAINAKASDPAPFTQMIGPMARALLEERFKLQIHRETREAPVYTLTVARSGKLLPVKDGSCIPVDLDHLPPMPERGQAPPRLCGNQRMRMNGKTVNMAGTGLSMADFAGGMLSNVVDRPVIDKTGLEGLYDIDVEFAPDSSMPMFQGRGGRGDGVGDAGAVPLATEPEGPTIFAALEKLGLKLEAARGPVEVIVIDHVERPSEN